MDKIRATPSKDRESIPILFLRGGVGSGKSRGILAPIMEVLIDISGINVLWVRQDLKDLKLSVMQKFLEIMPPNLIVKKDGQMGWHEIAQSMGTRSRIFWNGAKDIGGFGSQEFGVIAATEAHEISYQAFMALKRRCRQENVVNFMLLESEPPHEAHWLTKITDPASDMYDKDVEVWELSTYENWKNLPQSYKGSLEGMPEAWKKKYLYGKPGFIPDGKPFYNGFKAHLHVRDLIYNPMKELLIGIDYGYHHPAVVVTQMDLNDRWNVLLEIMGNDVVLDKFMDHTVIPTLNEHFSDFKAKWFGDPAGKQKTDKTELTSVEIMKSKGIDVESKPSEYRQRKEYLEKRLGTLIGDKTALQVNTPCKIIIDGFLGGYHYASTTDKRPAYVETPFRDGFYEHVMNALEYIAVGMFKPFEPSNKGVVKELGSLAHEYKKPMFKF